MAAKSVIGCTRHGSSDWVVWLARSLQIRCHLSGAAGRMTAKGFGTGASSLIAAASSTGMARGQIRTLGRWSSHLPAVAMVGFRDKTCYYGGRLRP